MLPLSLLTTLVTMGRKARWMATITPPAAGSLPAELALLDRHTNEQRLITPAHNSFDQAFSKIYENKVGCTDAMGTEICQTGDGCTDAFRSDCACRRGALKARAAAEAAP
jgi:hypothetical protein